nr:MAG TPA: hypothetical protein [Caudoviricetes sp.]
MENRFLFRGKRIDNGEWVEGMPFEVLERAIEIVKGGGVDAKTDS